MNVLCFTNIYPSPAEPSAGCFVRDLVEDLRGLDVDVQVLAFSGRERRQAYAEAGLEFRRTIAAGDFDLVHAHYGLTGVLAVTQRSVPVVVTFHGSDTGNPRVRWQAWFSWFVARLVHPSSSAGTARCASAVRMRRSFRPASTSIFSNRSRERRRARRSAGPKKVTTCSCRAPERTPTKVPACLTRPSMRCASGCPTSHP